jgi:hypothetical protein
MPTDDAPTGGRFYIEVVGDELDGQTHDIGEDGLLIGRAPDCDLVFANPEVSRRHAYFYPDGNSCFVKDLGSRNGILVNGRPAREKRLRPRDIVDVGPSRLFVCGEGADAASEDEAQPAPGLLSQRHPLASAALVFGALSCLHWGFGVGAIVLGAIALWELRREEDDPGRVLAIGGLALGAVGMAAVLWFGPEAPEPHRQAADAGRLACRDNLQKLAIAVRDYREAHSGIWPPTLDSLTVEGLLTEDGLYCPAAPPGAPHAGRYIFVSGLAQAASPGLDIIACDSSLAAHSGEGGWVLRADARIEWRTAENMGELLDALADSGLVPRSGLPLVGGPP